MTRPKPAVRVLMDMVDAYIDAAVRLEATVRGARAAAPTQ